MLTFQTLTWEDRNVIKPFLDKAPGYLCDYAPGTLMMWGEYYHTEYTVWQDTLIVRNEYEAGQISYMFPCGKDTEGAIWEIYAYHKSVYGEKPVFQSIPEEGKKLLCILFPQASAEFSRDWEDYLYEAKPLVTFAGRKYSKHRNLMHQFEAMYPDYEFVPLNAGNAPLVRDFYLDYWERFSKNTDSAVEEYEIILDMLEDFEQYRQNGMVGGYVENGGKVIAFSIGELWKDALIVHVEKADTAYKGAYQMMVKEFAAAYASDEFVHYINREEDMGIEGLRQSKLAYHPLELLPKYAVTL